MTIDIELFKKLKKQAEMRIEALIQRELSDLKAVCGSDVTEVDVRYTLMEHRDSLSGGRVDVGVVTTLDVSLKIAL